MVNIESITTVLEENKMMYNVTQSGFKESIFLTHNLRSYRVETEDNKIKLLEYNMANNHRHKNRYHFVNSYTEPMKMIGFIKNRLISI